MQTDEAPAALNHFAAILLKRVEQDEFFLLNRIATLDRPAIRIAKLVSPVMHSGDGIWPFTGHSSGSAEVNLVVGSKLDSLVMIGNSDMN